MLTMVVWLALVVAGINAEYSAHYGQGVVLFLVATVVMAVAEPSGEDVQARRRSVVKVVV